ncbi:Crp/Fnr family transcriptional regulator [Cytophagaceae bacterium YF14B1]|uniref:Crp/Fnr family transcriptional regulator n=1 Tax=Xanthocytophaga flava TaxID=3048013 RepID=A0AAE3QVT7_9BACT|nr:Crp/Fnr family transcriptional regulator [Xanthocytophaga flavus]MDJ1484181.1 Crp/Fnr family transcriptional regulator [Xanthocytophaga flavus]
MNILREHIRSLFKLNEEEASVFLAEFIRKDLQKDDVFIAEGEICKKVGLIEKGLMVCTYHKNGNEIIDEFAFENGFVTNYYSFLTGTPSEKTIRCIEDTTVYVISRQSLEKVSRHYAFIERMAGMMNERLFLRTHDRVKSMLLDTATERYQKLVAQRKDMVQRIPQYMLASYLHVKPETLSRIRKKLAKKIN